VAATPEGLEVEVETDGDDDGDGNGELLCFRGGGAWAPPSSFRQSIEGDSSSTVVEREAKRSRLKEKERKKALQKSDGG
jgi:hypothetical protein